MWHAAAAAKSRRLRRQWTTYRIFDCPLPQQPLRIDVGHSQRSAMTVLACDMGGTRIKLGVVRDGAVLASDIIPAQSDRGLAARLPALAKALKALCRSAGVQLEGCDG